jgi:hypothetical protein
LRYWDAILALLIRLMRLFALVFYLNQEMLEAFVLDIGKLVLARGTIGAFLSWRVVAGILYFLQILFCHSQTVYAFSIRSVRAVRFLYFFLRKYLRLGLG